MLKAIALLLAVAVMLAGCARQDSGDSQIGLSGEAEGAVSELEAPQAPPMLDEPETEEAAEEAGQAPPLARPELDEQEAAELLVTGEDGIISISTPMELCALAVLVNAKDTGAMGAKVELKNNLNLSGMDFVPIGADGTAFSGSFDGGGNVITGLTILGENDAVGLFGTIGAGGTVTGVNITGANIYGGNEVGGIAGSNSGTVKECSFRGTIEAQGRSVGGICGVVKGVEGVAAEASGASQATAGRILRCASNAQVSGHEHVGGLAGDVGGLALVQDSYALGSVTALKGNGSVTPNSVGGLCGVVNGIVSECYVSIEVYTKVSSKIVGGFIGLIDGGEVSDCYYNLKPVENWKEVGYVVGETQYEIIGCTVSEITERQTFEDWDFSAVWAISDNQNRGLPFLRDIMGV